jgi:hypothetical protein
MKNRLEDSLVATKLVKKMKGWIKLPNGAVAVEEHVYVPRDEQLRQEVIQEHHDSRVAGHLGRYKTQELITRNYWWAMISRDVKSYVGGCKVCQRAKVIHELSHVHLHPYSILMIPWKKVSVDLVGLLPVSNEHDMIMVVVYWLTKAMVAIPTTSMITMDEVARLFQNNVCNWYRLPRTIISNRGLQFVSQLVNSMDMGNPCGLWVWVSVGWVWV